MLAEILLVRPDLIVLISLYAYLKSFGYSNPKMDKLVPLLWHSAACQRLEFPYWRKLDIFHSLEKLQLAEFPDFAEENCWFSGQPEPWIMSDEIAYGVTHAVFYITDFGRYPERISSTSRMYLKSWNPAWLNIFSMASNWDVVSELLMVASCIAKDDDLEEYYVLVANASENDGMIPSPSGAGRQLIDLEGDCSAKRKRFLGNYHTCLVALMASVLRESGTEMSGKQ
jgi:hypothetical protein